MVAAISAVWLGGLTALIFTLSRIYYPLLRGPADVPAALRGATISSPLYWTAVALAFVAAFALGKYWARAALSISVGLAVFMGLGFFYMLVSAVRGPVQPGHATAVSVIFAATIWNPLFYSVLLGCLAFGVFITSSRWWKPAP